MGLCRVPTGHGRHHPDRFGIDLLVYATLHGHLGHGTIGLHQEADDHRAFHLGFLCR